MLRARWARERVPCFCGFLCVFERSRRASGSLVEEETNSQMQRTKRWWPGGRGRGGWVTPGKGLRGAGDELAGAAGCGGGNRRAMPSQPRAGLTGSGRWLSTPRLGQVSPPRCTPQTISHRKNIVVEKTEACCTGNETFLEEDGFGSRHAPGVSWVPGVQQPRPRGAPTPGACGPRCAPLKVGFAAGLSRCFPRPGGVGRALAEASQCGCRFRIHASHGGWELGPLRAPHPVLVEGPSGFFCIKVTGLFAEMSKSLGVYVQTPPEQPIYPTKPPPDTSPARVG